MSRTARTVRIFLITTGMLMSIAAQARKGPRPNIVLEWEAIDGARAYEIEIQRKDERHAHAFHFHTKLSHWSAHIKSGIYSMRIRSFDVRGVPGSWSTPSDLNVKLSPVELSAPQDHVVLTSPKDNETVQFRWQSVPEATHYKIHVQSLTSSWSTDDQVEATRWSKELPAGQRFSWSVTALNANNEAGEDGGTKTFTLRGPPLPSPEIQRPLSPYIQTLSWEPVPHAENYTYTLAVYNRHTRQWTQLEQKVQTSTTVPLNISQPSGIYRLAVQARSTIRKSSIAAALNFKRIGGFRSPAALETAELRDSITKPKPYYAIASYLLTEVQYASRNYDDNVDTAFHALGGTGRIGLGYQSRKSRWGAYGIVDLSGFLIHNKNFTFASVELHGTRAWSMPHGGLLRVGAGLFLKQLPMVEGTTSTGFSGVGTAQDLGPHVGVVYWVPLTPRLGLQTQARLYYSLFGSAQDEKIEPTPSYEVGLLGSYRIKRDWMGYAGYTYRLDETQFATDSARSSSFAQPGDINSIDLQGHYLNLILEYSF